MKITIKFLMLTSLLAAGLSTAQAQQRGNWSQDPTERANQQTQLMSDSLALSKKQAEKVSEINLKYAKKMQDAREANTEGDWTAMRAAIQQMRTEQNAELKTVLTSDQSEKWTKIQEEQMQQRREGRGKQGDGKRGSSSGSGSGGGSEKRG